MTVFDSCNLSHLTVKRHGGYSFKGGKSAIALENRGWAGEGGAAWFSRLSGRVSGADAICYGYGLWCKTIS